MTWKYLIEVPWIVFVAYWAIGALKTRRTAKKRILRLPLRDHVSSKFSASLCSSTDDAEDWRPWPSESFLVLTAIAITGVVLLWAGIALALWARWHLGAILEWPHHDQGRSQTDPHRPYARLRHPIYSGLDLAAIGSALAIDRGAGGVGVCVMIVAFWVLD